MSTGHEIARILFQEAWNEGNYGNLEFVFAPGCVFHTAGGPVQYGVDEQIQLIDDHRKSFSDIHFEIHHVIDDGDHIAAHVSMTGTHTGEYAGHPASGRSVEVGEMLFMRLESGKVAEIWGIFDTYHERVQLGFI
jgi:steroid delta-isomerase-like uncharacterized protein